MKMPEKHDLLAAILTAKEQGIGAILAFAMAYLRGRYKKMAVRLPKTVIRRSLVFAVSPDSFVTFSDFMWTSSNLAYITSDVYRLHRY